MPSIQKSKKTEEFEKWLANLTPEKIDLLEDLERHARIVVHEWDLIHDVNVRDMHGLARTVKKIRGRCSE